MTNKAYSTGLDRNAANHVSLSPLTFIARTAAVFPDATALVHGDLRQNWRDTYARCRRLASALAQHGIGKDDTVATMLPNVPPMFEAHFGVPMAGAVLNTLNTRLDAEAIAFMLDHGEAKAIIVDPEFSSVIAKALPLCKIAKPLVVDAPDAMFGSGKAIGTTNYEDFLAEGDEDFSWSLPPDEWDAISLNYTSGTTGNPKGVVTHHRGAYLNAVANLVSWPMPQHSVYLWTLPMFHCNGWCFPWTMAANAGASVCLRRVEAAPIFEAIATHGVTHFCGAPIVMGMLVNAPDSDRKPFAQKVQAMVAGAAPPAAIIEGMETLGIAVTHVYGLTETYGPASICAKHEDWASLPIAEQAKLNGRQGVPNLMQEAVAVFDTETMQPVPHDGETMGEIFFRGNVVMKGYLKNAKATEEAFTGGWFHTGDLAVVDPDGYVKIKDRSKDIIISGGENISSIEVEDALFRHPAVIGAAVVATPDPKWGEVPCAFVELRDGARPSAEELIDHCRQHLARFKVPKQFVFGPLPKTSTGKIQKFLLREKAKSAAAIE